MDKEAIRAMTAMTLACFLQAPMQLGQCRYPVVVPVFPLPVMLQLRRPERTDALLCSLPHLVPRFLLPSTHVPRAYLRRAAMAASLAGGGALPHPGGLLSPPGGLNHRERPTPADSVALPPPW